MREKTISAASRFAEELRSWRELRGWTQEETARNAHLSLSYLRKIEGATRTASRSVAEALDVAFGTPKTFQRQQAQVALESHPSWFAPVVGFESRAARIHEWEMRVVPGLVQTEEYARSVIRAGRPYDTADEIERVVIGRMERQSALTTAKPWWVLGEGVLRQMVGGREVMVPQLDKIIAAADTQCAIVQVLPFSATEVPGTRGPISMYEFDDDPAICYLEGHDGGRLVDDPGEVAQIAATLNMLKGCALSPGDSIALMTKIRGVLDA